MESFILTQSLSAQGFKVYNPFKARELSEVIVFNDDKLYVSRRESSVAAHSKIYRKAKKGTLAPEDLISGNFQSVASEDIKQTFCTNEITGDFSESPFGTAAVWYCPKNYYIRFYETVNVDVEKDYYDKDAKAKIHSLWLAIPEVKELLRPYLIPVNGETSIEEHGSWFNTTVGGSAVGDHNLGLVLWEDSDQWERCNRVTYA